MRVNYLAIIRLFVISVVCIPQSFAREINLEIIFGKPLDFKKLSINVDDGYDKMPQEFKVVNNTIHLRHEVHATYGTVEIIYNEKDHHFRESFWVKKGVKSSIRFSNEQGFLKSYQLQHVLDINASGNDRMEKYIQKEWIDFGDYLVAYNDRRGEHDSISRTIQHKMNVLTNKKLEYCRNNPNDFFSLWLFEKHITEYNSKDELMAVYDAFPLKFRTYFEAKEALNKINGYSIKTGEIAPDLNIKDINGKKVLIHDSGSKFTLINFWASWCKPCMEEVPALKALKNKYPEKDLRLISITSDQNYRNFMDAKTRLDMNWTHIARNTSINSSYGVDAIPRSFLLDGKGKILMIVTTNKIDGIETYLSDNLK